MSDALRLCFEWRIQTLPAHYVPCVSLLFWYLPPQQTHSGGQVHTGEVELSGILAHELQASMQKKKGVRRMRIRVLQTGALVFHFKVWKASVLHPCPSPVIVMIT